jgi:hypothetical protein
VQRTVASWDAASDLDNVLLRILIHLKGATWAARIQPIFPLGRRFGVFGAVYKEMMQMLTKIGRLLAVFGLTATLPLVAAQLGQDARAAIPKNVTQVIVVDYHAMQNSPAAMEMKAKILPRELKQLEQALNSSGLNENRDIDELAFASFKDGSGVHIVGVAQGQFSPEDILAGLRKHKVKSTLYRKNEIYPMGQDGMLVSFLSPTTMIFGLKDALTSALDARDGMAPNFLSNNAMLDQMKSVDTEPVWSILDEEGTQFMMRSVLGDAAQLADYDNVKKRLLSSRYSMNFDNGVKFNLDVTTPDTISAATMASLMNAAALYTRMSGTATEKLFVDGMTIDSSGGVLDVSFVASNTQFTSLVNSDLFQSVVK